MCFIAVNKRLRNAGLDFCGSPFDHGGKKTVRAVLRRERPEKAVRSDNAFHWHGLLKNVLQDGSRVSDLKLIAELTQHFAHH